MTANEGGYCVDCPDHEACSTGWPCWKVKELAELRSARAAIGPDSERAKQVIADALDAVKHPDVRAGIDYLAKRLRAAGLLLGPDKVAVDREALHRSRVLLERAWAHANITGAERLRDDIAAALSEPQPKPEGTS